MSQGTRVTTLEAQSNKRLENIDKILFPLYDINWSGDKYLYFISQFLLL